MIFATRASLYRSWQALLKLASELKAGVDPLLSAALFDWGTRTKLGETCEQQEEGVFGSHPESPFILVSEACVFLLGFPGHLPSPDVLGFCFPAHSTR